MRYNTKLKAMLIRHEALRLKPYRCTKGKLTIGVGRNIEDNGISQSEAMYLLDNDIMECIKDLSSFKWFTTLDPVRQAAIIDMRFNLGYHRFREFKKMIAAFERGDLARATREMVNSDWYDQVGDRSEELVKMIHEGRWRD